MNGYRAMSGYRKWLALFTLVLVLLGAFAPFADPLDGILSLLGAVLVLVFAGTAVWEERRARQADRSA